MLNRIELITSSFLISILLLLLIFGCTSLETGSREVNNRQRSPEFQNRFTISQQKAPPREIQSVQLYRKGSMQSAPIITLNSSEKLSLEFDHLGEGTKQFRLTVSHRSKNWEESPLPPDFYLTGFSEVYFSNASKSFSQRPSYFHYTYEFPNSQLNFKASGNYLLSVYDYNNNELLFTLPFFVTENQGSLDTRVETLYVRRDDLRPEDQPFSRYRYPDFVEFPQFDLSYMYVQNQFWGRYRVVENSDTATPEVVNFHLSRDRAFLGNYEFNALDLRSLRADGQQILEVQQGEIPPKVILRRDIQSFDVKPGFAPDGRFGIPLDNRSASYANVQFRLETSGMVSGDENIFLLGDFNNWTINNDNRMQYNVESDLWEGQAFIKEGEYAYKYVMVKNGNIDDLSLDRGFQRTGQNYVTFVYYKDPTRNYDRLLKVEQTQSRSF
ncbi:DUF5103 domain-containing protein [Balneolaceae bacterium YR4-1]|uniref:DUF5103 domain-containing protein n=1 Tax=Halalkalibaculum roseum TaxID=2709311 RepID=A0A6M1SV74_9BACT|nr:type IX secretion system plug protein domain-containing protein [Halalkalibaculum roseum]NGP76870.1 DUF5103 domain-containing protein [Halalkalibaculum roseum]